MYIRSRAHFFDNVVLHGCFTIMTYRLALRISSLYASKAMEPSSTQFTSLNQYTSALHTILLSRLQKYTNLCTTTPNHMLEFFDILVQFMGENTRKHLLVFRLFQSSTFVYEELSKLRKVHDIWIEFFFTYGKKTVSSLPVHKPIDHVDKRWSSV